MLTEKNLNEFVRNRLGKNQFQLFFLLMKDMLFQSLNCLIKGKSAFYKDLPKNGRVYYSQKREELIIRSVFKDRKRGFFLDVGCAWPFSDSTSCFLEKNLGWRGIAIDANPAQIADWKMYRPLTKLFTFIVTDHFGTIDKFYKAGGLGSTKKELKFHDKIIRGKEVDLPTITLSKLLDDNGIKKIDFLSLDIELSEPQALVGFDIERFQPDLVCVERAPIIREVLLNYFTKHNYKVLTEFESLDKANWYFIPKLGNL